MVQEGTWFVSICFSVFHIDFCCGLKMFKFSLVCRATVFWLCFFLKWVFHKTPNKMGPLPVMNGVITPINSLKILKNWVITPIEIALKMGFTGVLSPLFSWSYGPLLRPLVFGGPNPIAESSLGCNGRAFATLVLGGLASVQRFSFALDTWNLIYQLLQSDLLIPQLEVT